MNDIENYCFSICCSCFCNFVETTYIYISSEKVKDYFIQISLNSQFLDSLVVFLRTMHVSSETLKPADS